MTNNLDRRICPGCTRGRHSRHSFDYLDQENKVCVCRCYCKELDYQKRMAMDYETSPFRIPSENESDIEQARRLR